MTPRRRPARRRLLIAGAAAVVVASGLTVWAASGSPSRTSGDHQDRTTVELLRQTELERRQAEVDANLEVETRLLADDFTLVPPDGSTLARADFLGALKSGDLDFSAFEPVSVLSVRQYGDAAVLTYRADIRVSAPGAGELHHEAWHTVVYEKHAGNWQVHWEQSTGIGFQPPA